MTTVSDAITSTMGSIYTYVSSTVSSATSATSSAVSSSFTALVSAVKNVATVASTSFKKGWDVTVSACKDHPKITGVALVAIAAGTAYVGRAQIAAFPATVCNLIGKK